MTQGSGEVFDLGYQHYDGPREGRMRARKALWVDGVRTAIGLGRGPWAKLLPAALFLIVIMIAVILTITAVTTGPGGPGGTIPGHAEFYQIVSIFLLLFSAIIAPELICPDRRDGVISLYLVRPLSPTDYVAGRWLAFFAITLGLVYSGQVVLLIGFTLAADEPLGYLRDNWLDMPRFVGAGFLVALYTTTLPMAVAAFTTRRAYAATFVIGLSVISAPVAGAMTECDFQPVIQGVYEGVDEDGNWIVMGVDGPVDHGGNFMHMAFFGGEVEFEQGPVPSGGQFGRIPLPFRNRFVIRVDESTKVETTPEVGREIQVTGVQEEDGIWHAQKVRPAYTGCDTQAGKAAKWLALVDLFRMPIHLSDMVFNEENESAVSALVTQLPKIVPIGWYLVLTAGPGLVLWWRYQRIAA